MDWHLFLYPLPPLLLPFFISIPLWAVFSCIFIFFWAVFLSTKPRAFLTVFSSFRLASLFSPYSYLFFVTLPTALRSRNIFVNFGSAAVKSEFRLRLRKIVRLRIRIRQFNYGSSGSGSATLLTNVYVFFLFCIFPLLWPPDLFPRPRLF